MLKATAIKLFGAKCFYCQKRLKHTELTIDHLYPKSRFKKVAYNGVPACRRCNFAKADMTVDEFRRHIIQLVIRFVIPSFLAPRKVYAK